MNPEKKFEDAIIAEFGKKGWYAHHFDAVGADGWPDIIALKGNQYRLVEVKAGSAVSREQKAFHAFLDHMHDVEVTVIELRKGLPVITSPGLPFVCSGVSEAVTMVILHDRK